MESELIGLKEKGINPKLLTLSSKGQIVIPKELRESLALRTGETIIMVKVKDGAYFRKFDLELFNKVLNDINNQKNLIKEFDKIQEKKVK